MIKGSKHSEIARERIRIGHLGKKQSKEHIMSRVKSREGYRHSEETKQKMSIARFKNPIVHFGDNNPSKRPEVKLKIGLKQKGVKETSEATIKTHAWNKDFKKRQEVNQKLKITRQFQIFPIKDTSIEIKLQQLLTFKGIIFEKHKSIFGQPDIFIEPDICIFADGDYWHNLEKSKVRDKEVNNNLLQKGYRILRFSEYDIKNNIEKIEKVLNENLS